MRGSSSSSRMVVAFFREEEEEWGSFVPLLWNNREKKLKRVCLGAKKRFSYDPYSYCSAHRTLAAASQKTANVVWGFWTNERESLSWFPLLLAKVIAVFVYAPRANEKLTALFVWFVPRCRFAVRRYLVLFSEWTLLHIFVRTDDEKMPAGIPTWLIGTRTTIFALVQFLTKKWISHFYCNWFIIVLQVVRKKKRNLK